MADFPTFTAVAAEHQYVVRHWGDGYTEPREEFIGCSCNVEYWGHIQHADCTCYEGGYFDEADEAPQKHAEHVHAEWVAARTIETVEQLDALPLNSVVVDASGIPRTNRTGDSVMRGGWTNAGRIPISSRELADGRPMVVVYHPERDR